MVKWGRNKLRKGGVVENVQQAAHLSDIAAKQGGKALLRDALIGLCQDWPSTPKNRRSLVFKKSREAGIRHLPPRNKRWYDAHNIFACMNILWSTAQETL